MEKETKRNYGIDLLRVLSMLYVVIVHVVGYGGILDGAREWSRQYQFGWAMYLWTICAVDIFGLISGYVGYTETPRPHHYENYLVMWLQVVVYGVAATAVFGLIEPGLVTGQDMLRMLFPVKNGLYWYFTAYTGMFFLIPLLNAGIRSCSEGYLRKAFAVLVVLFSVMQMAADYFVLNGGYSFAWLVILYLLGAILKKCGIGRGVRPITAFAGIFILCVAGWAWKIYGTTLRIGDITLFKESFEQHTSPNVLLVAVLYVVGFSGLEFKSPVWKRIIRFAAPGAFAVYLLNNQQFIWETLFVGQFARLGQGSVYALFGHVMVFSCGFVAAALLLDHLRQRLFRVLRVRETARWLVTKVNWILHWCTGQG